MATRPTLDEALRFRRPNAAESCASSSRVSEGEEHDEDPAVVKTTWATELELRATRAIRGEGTAKDLTAVCNELDAKRSSRT